MQKAGVQEVHVKQVLLPLENRTTIALTTMLIGDVQVCIDNPFRVGLHVPAPGLSTDALPPIRGSTWELSERD